MERIETNLVDDPVGDDSVEIETNETQEYACITIRFEISEEREDIVASKVILNAPRHANANNKR